MNNKAFRKYAGGYLFSDKHYDQYTSQERREKFWRFFFYEWYGKNPIRCAYSGIEIDDLKKEKLLSIEHVVPLSVLWKALKEKGMVRQVLFGATVNPLNMIPVCKEANTMRANSEYDLEDDEIVHPSTCSLLKCTAQSGFDFEYEWVVPPRSKGNIARSLLYMVALYNLPLYTKEEIVWLVHQCKQDQPSNDEKAYNEWVKKKYKIHNPLIEENAEVFVEAFPKK